MGVSYRHLISRLSRPALKEGDTPKTHQRRAFLGPRVRQFRSAVKMYVSRLNVDVTRFCTWRYTLPWSLDTGQRHGSRKLVFCSISVACGGKIHLILRVLPGAVQMYGAGVGVD